MPISDEDTKQAIHSINVEMQSIRKSVDTQGRRIDKLELLTADHIKACAVNQQTIVEVRDILNTMRAGQKITNALRNGTLWCAGLFVAIAEAVKWAKEWFS